MANQFDVIVVGGGLAGAALALALAPTALRIAVVEGGNPQTWLGQGDAPLSAARQDDTVADFDARVSALTEASRVFLDQLGIWNEVAARRVCPYTEMTVWDAEGTGEIHFSAETVQRASLGHIVENRLIVAALHQALAETGQTLLFGARVTALSADEGRGSTELTLDDGRQLRGKLVVAADGALSKIRTLAGFVTREWDYQHHAIACTVECGQPHRATAYQRFLPEGPLAFLPLADSDGQQRFCSIVWSALPELAEELMALDDTAFCHRLGAAFEHRLGDVVATGRRFSFPLRQRHARDYVRGGVVLTGDAAHTIHPLAGQGINLGFADVRVLAEELQRGLQRGLSVNDPGLLQRYQRRRKGDNLAMMAAMEGFQQLFGSSVLPLRLVRNLGMNWLDRRPLLKRRLIAQAMGL